MKLYNKIYRKYSPHPPNLEKSKPPKDESYSQPKDRSTLILRWFQFICNDD